MAAFDFASDPDPLLGDGVRLADLFAGIGGIRLGFAQWGCRTVFSSEIDPHATRVYADNFGEQPFGDINDLPPVSVPDHDILLAGFPCQPFSIAGKGLGFADTRGTLFFNIHEILRAKKPRAFLLENVKRLTSHQGGQTFGLMKKMLTALGYQVFSNVLNSLDFGLPQKRERLYIVGFREKTAFAFPEKTGDPPPLSDILEPVVPPSYYLSDRLRAKRQAALKKTPVVPAIWHENIGGNISPLPYSCALRAGGSYNYLVVNGERRLTGREMLRLQGFPDSFRADVPYTQIRKMAGNSVSVPVIRLIAQQMLLSLRGDVPPQTSIKKQMELAL